MSQLTSTARNAVVVTKHLSFHVREGRCIAVVERATDSLAPDHLAVGQPLICGDIRVGKRLRFANDVASSEIEAVKAPAGQTG